MLNRSRARLSGALLLLTVLVAGCSARSAAPQGRHLPQPEPRFAEPSTPQASIPVAVPPPVAFDLTPTDAPQEITVVVEPMYEPRRSVLEAVVAADRRPIEYDIDIPLNDRVTAFVRLLSGRLKSFLEEGLSRGVQFLPMVQDVFRAEGLPLDLAYVPLVESAFKPTALSRAKARGIWQFMRGTGLENGLSHDWYIDERADPEKATRAAAKYLKTLNSMFDGDWHLALASYNGGPGRVQRAMRRSGRSDFWQVSASSRYLPRETRDYVPLVLAAIIIARNPAEYGLNVQPVTPPRYETIALPAAVDLRRLSAWIGTPVETIRSLNPELRQWMTPLNASGYALKIPDGTGDILRAHFEQTAPEHLTAVNWHTVKKGDTLLSVAKKLKVTRAELAEANGLSVRARLAAGQQLIVPRAPELPEVVLPPFAPSAVAPVVAAELDPALPERTPAPAAVVAVKRSPAPKPAAPKVHRVRRGDTLFSIARLYRTTVTAIKGWNRLRTDSIQVGQRLRIFNERPATATH